MAAWFLCRSLFEKPSSWEAAGITLRNLKWLAGKSAFSIGDWLLFHCRVSFWGSTLSQCQEIAGLIVWHRGGGPHTSHEIKGVPQQDVWWLDQVGLSWMKSYPRDNRSGYHDDGLIISLAKNIFSGFRYHFTSGDTSV